MAGNSSGPHTRPSLLLRMRNARDQEAWDTFVSVYSPLVYGHCQKKGLQPADAEDVTQTVLTQVSQAIRTFDYRPEKGRFRAWLGTVVRHEISRFRRKQTRQPAARGGDNADSLPHPGEPTTEEPAWTEEFNAYILQVALARTRPHFQDLTWQAFEAVWLHDRPAAEVARELHRDVSWVHVAKSRVLKRLRQEVEDLAYENS